MMEPIVACVLLLAASTAQAEAARFRVSRTGAAAELPGFDALPASADGLAEEVEVTLDAGGDAYTLRVGDGVALGPNLLRAAEVARTADDAMTLGLFSVNPDEPVFLEVRAPAGATYRSAFAALFSSAPPKLGLMKRLETAIADLKGIPEAAGDGTGTWLFSCHDDAEVSAYLQTSKLDPALPPPVAELQEQGGMILPGIHQFVQTSPPPPERFDGACMREPAAATGPDPAGCRPFDVRGGGNTVRGIRQCMMGALDGPIADLVEAEWTHADGTGKLPARESGTNKGTKSPLRGTWTSKADFAAALPRFIATRLFQKLSWASWDAKWSRQGTSRESELGSWRKTVRYQIGRATGLRGPKTDDHSRPYPFRRFEETLSGDTLDALAACVLDFPSPLRTKYKLRCFPTLLDVPGVVANGLADDIASWTEPHVVKHNCPGIHPTCAKLGVELMLKKFAVHRFSLLAWLGASTHSGRPQWSSCLSVTHANCRFFSGCWAKATRRVCGAIPECCPPGSAAHADCAIDPGSMGCKKSVCPENKGRVEGGAGLLV